MSEEENIDAYLSSREREHKENQDQTDLEPSVSGGVYRAVVEGEETNEAGETPASTVEEPQPQPQPQPRQQGKRASMRKIQRSMSDVSKQLEKQTIQINKVSQVVQGLQKQTKSAQRQSELISQIRSQVNQIQRQITQVQKSIQKKPSTASTASVRKSTKKNTSKKK